jgi:hypothetical protein
MISEEVGIERVKTLYSVIAGVPNKYVNLDAFVDVRNVYIKDKPNIEVTDIIHNCGTSACVGGWAAIYPPFVDAGLSIDFRGGITVDGNCFASNFEALEKFFSIDSSVLDPAIFDERCEHGPFAPDLPSNASDKQIALHRIRLYLLEKGAITEERSKELAKFEKDF